MAGFGKESWLKRVGNQPLDFPSTRKANSHRPFPGRELQVVAVDWILVGLDGFAVAELAPEMQWLQIIRMVRAWDKSAQALD